MIKLEDDDPRVSRWLERLESTRESLEREELDLDSARERVLDLERALLSAHGVVNNLEVIVATRREDVELLEFATERAE